MLNGGILKEMIPFDRMWYFEDDINHRELEEMIEQLEFNKSHNRGGRYALEIENICTWLGTYEYRPTYCKEIGLERGPRWLGMLTEWRSVPLIPSNRDEAEGSKAIRHLAFFKV